MVILICDNLNTHTKEAFDEAFAPERARKFVRRIEFHLNHWSENRGPLQTLESN